MTNKTSSICVVDNAAAVRTVLELVRNAGSLHILSRGTSMPEHVCDAVAALFAALQDHADDATLHSRVAALLEAACQLHGEPVQAGARDCELTGLQLVLIAPMSYWQRVTCPTRH